VQVIGRVLGIPRAEYPKYQKWALELVGFSKDPPKGMAASQAFRTYLLPIIQAHRAAPTDDVISKLVTGTVDGVGLTDDEVVNFLRLLIPAGAETTSRLIGSMLFALLVERDRYERVRADRSLVPWAIEETLRWETPVVFVAREATRSTEIRGVEIPEGKNVAVIIGAGNRDPEKYPEPDRFDLDRHADDHLSFGFGRHFCLGYTLAKLEARTALGAVLDRFPKLRIDPDAPPPAVRGMAFRSPPALPVRFD
jgi:cytochrome P450